MESRQGEPEGQDQNPGTGDRQLARGVIISALRDLGGSRDEVTAWWSSDLFVETCELSGWSPDWVSSLFDAVDALRFDTAEVCKSVTAECVRLLKVLSQEE